LSGKHIKLASKLSSLKSYGKKTDTKQLGVALGKGKYLPITIKMIILSTMFRRLAL